MFLATPVYVMNRKKMHIGFSATDTRAAVRLHGFDLYQSGPTSVLARRFVRFLLVGAHRAVSVLSVVAGSTQRLESGRKSISNQRRVQQHSAFSVGTRFWVYVIESKQRQHRETTTSARPPVVPEHQFSLSVVSRLIGHLSFPRVSGTPRRHAFAVSSHLVIVPRRLRVP